MRGKLPLDILFADTAVELIPPIVKRRLEGTRRKQQAPISLKILDVAEHGFAMNVLMDQGRRGRPDILHQCLLNTLKTPLAKTGNLGIFFHLQSQSVYGVANDTRLPRNYNRFVGVITKVLEDDHVPVFPPFTLRKSRITSQNSSRSTNTMKLSSCLGRVL